MRPGSRSAPRPRRTRPATPTPRRSRARSAAPSSPASASCARQHPATTCGGTGRPARSSPRPRWTAAWRPSPPPRPASGTVGRPPSAAAGARGPAPAARLRRASPFGRNADGTLVAFATGADGTFHADQAAPNGGWGPWLPIGPAGTDLTVVPSADGRLATWPARAASCTATRRRPAATGPRSPAPAGPPAPARRHWLARRDPPGRRPRPARTSPAARRHTPGGLAARPDRAQRRLERLAADRHRRLRCGPGEQRRRPPGGPPPPRRSPLGPLPAGLDLQIDRLVVFRRPRHLIKPSPAPDQADPGT